MVEEAKQERIAIILVRGLVGVTKSVKDTLLLLNLTRKNQCVIIKNNPVNKGMVQKVKDYVTFGDISEETYKELVTKRGKAYEGPLQDRKGKYSYKYVEVDGKKLKPYFNLNPPKKGFGRKGIKMPFTLGGALGNRKEKMNELIMRML